MEGFSHLDEKGNAVMVDVTAKSETQRIARASGRIYVGEEVYKAITSGTVSKGDVFACSRVAGIMAAKKTSELIPLCHPLLLTGIAVEFEPEEDKYAISCTCTVKLAGKTGVEMEALTGTSVALLTIYDMCKAISKRMEISDIHLEEKDGGKSGHFVR
ncbi:MAG: cyclic pyranopterin monophosphate synthase MoaC [Butyrivibrio sp.]|nr:cyclic pyranopterin monophosphate synthase MoaC [Butyrivibrio sp.]